MSETKYNIFISKTHYTNQYNIIIVLLFEKCMLLYLISRHFCRELFGEFLLQAIINNHILLYFIIIN